MKHQNRIILGIILGNLIEAFDMAICGLLSVYLAKYLIGGGGSGLLVVFATFFAGYLARPLGAFALGLFSDMINILTQFTTIKKKLNVIKYKIIYYI